MQQIVGVLVPQIMKGDVDDLQHVPEERVQNSVVEQIGSVPAPQIWEPIVEGVQLIPQERESWVCQTWRRRSQQSLCRRS